MLAHSLPVTDHVYDSSANNNNNTTVGRRNMSIKSLQRWRHTTLESNGRLLNISKCRSDLNHRGPFTTASYRKAAVTVGKLIYGQLSRLELVRQGQLVYICFSLWLHRYVLTL